MLWEIRQGDALEVLRSIPAQSINTCVTSPPYWGLRDYGVEGQLGLEPTPEEYVGNLVEVFREVKRVLRDDGTLWLNLGDCYNGSGGAGGDYAPGGLKEGQPKYPGRNIVTLKPKDLVGIPWRVAFALQADGWYLRSDIIWAKPNPMPESVTDRPTNAHEYIFLLSKSRQYYYDQAAIKEPCSESNIYISSVPMRNKRTVWHVNTKPFKGAHFAVFPPGLIEPCILAGCPQGGMVLDPFCGSGTTLLVATEWHRKSIGIELNPEYIQLAEKRLGAIQLKMCFEGGVANG